MSTASTSRPTVARPAARAASALAAGQGAFYLGTGVWPLVHIESFVAVTGPKTDLWLVYTVGVMVADVGAALLSAAGPGRVTPEVRLLAVGAAVGLAATDVTFVSRGVIDRVYLLGAAAEAVLVLGWLCVSVAAGDRT